MHLRYRNMMLSQGKPVVQRVQASRVLLIGAGGIGCELLKNLVCCGFGASPSATNSPSTEQHKPEIVVVDLDTIDLSNLNRQFLFRKHHLKKPKAFVAKETASQFNPDCTIAAHHASIFDRQYDVDFFESFDLVFNALDNLAARRHVNRMCLAAHVPLIESGTTGFNGQVQAILKGVTECYDCTTKPVQKSFPICTIRSTPSQPIHCIVWAKSYLFPELFGTSDEDSSDVAVTADDNAEEVAKLQEEAEALKKVRAIMGKSEFAQEVFNKVFRDDIERLRSMSEMWQSRRPPDTLDYEMLKADSNLIEKGQAAAAQDQEVWSSEENLAVFCSSLHALSTRVRAGENVIEFDKDDKDTLDFVASAANLRSQVFGIAPHSEWEIKQMAGNIIPAIATSNALTASLCVLQAFKILRSLTSKANTSTMKNNHGTHVSVNGKEEALLGGAKMVFLNSRNTERMILSESLAPPNPECPVCSPVYARVKLPEDGSTTLQHLVDLLKGTIGYAEFSITTDAGLVFDPDLDDNLAKPLQDLGVASHGHGFITVADDADEPKVDLILSVTAAPSPSDVSEKTDVLELVPTHVDLPLKPKKPVQTNGAAPAPAAPEFVPASNSGAKRKREAEEDLESPVKKAKAGGVVDSASMVVVEDDGAILVDD